MQDIKDLKSIIANVDQDLTKLTTGANVHSMASIRQRIIAVVYNLEDACNTKEVMEKFLQSGDCQASLSKIVRDAVSDSRMTKQEATAIRQAVAQIIASLNMLADTCDRIAE